MHHAIHRGFTLVELMIAVAVVGILAAIGYPSYVGYTVKTHRSAAQSHMHALANRQEQYLLSARSYASNLAALNLALPEAVAERYSFSVSADMTTSPPSYRITATPIGAQLSHDTACGTLTLDQTGERTQSGTAANAAACW